MPFSLHRNLKTTLFVWQEEDEKDIEKKMNHLRELIVTQELIFLFYLKRWNS